jgi:hypothetical protein
VHTHTRTRTNAHLECGHLPLSYRPPLARSSQVGVASCDGCACGCACVCLCMWLCVCVHGRPHTHSMHGQYTGGAAAHLACAASTRRARPPHSHRPSCGRPGTLPRRAPSPTRPGQSAAATGGPAGRRPVRTWSLHGLAWGSHGRHASQCPLSHLPAAVLHACKAARAHLCMQRLCSCPRVGCCAMLRPAASPCCGALVSPARGLGWRPRGAR